MTGMLQRGALTLLQLGSLPLVGIVPQDTVTTLTVPTPYAKAGDVPLFSMAGLPQGLGAGWALLEWYCIDGGVCLTVRPMAEGGAVFDTTVNVALLRSPGFPGAMTPIGRFGSAPRLGLTSNPPGPGPELPVWFEDTSNPAEVTLAAGEAKVVDMPIWAGGAPPGESGLMPCQPNGPSLTPGGVIVTGWALAAVAGGPGSLFSLGLKNTTAAPVVIPIGGLDNCRVIAAGGRGFTPATRAWAMGGRQMGVVDRYHVKAVWPNANQDVVATPSVRIDTSPATGPSGQKVPLPQTPTASRCWATAIKGLGATTVTGIQRPNIFSVTTGGPNQYLYAAAATTLTGLALQADLHGFDILV